MNIRPTNRPQLASLPDGCPQVTYRGTEHGTIVLCDEFRAVEMIAPGQFVGAWIGTTFECDIPSWIRRAGFQALRTLCNVKGR